ncbi:hypothetical protein [Roseospira goensis]|uniref:Uncharacterized protein n=1 Tax=Roseospira goensis TaxID=391922 RepID=A0A7W6WKE2_9PROT|nr:hypothetical protein [Roseospira goensis]MBB4286231.1 hypothetical protein [Roseospira goensis]
MIRAFPTAAAVAAAAVLAVATPAAAQSPEPIKEIGVDGNPPRVVFECTTPNGPPIRMDMVLRRMAGQVWAYSSLERAVDCSSLSTGGITCMAEAGRGRGWTLQATLNDLLADEGVRCTRVF